MSVTECTAGHFLLGFGLLHMSDNRRVLAQSGLVLAQLWLWDKSLQGMEEAARTQRYSDTFPGCVMALLTFLLAGLNHTANFRLKEQGNELYFLVGGPASHMVKGTNGKEK